ncbi:MAG: hypothetical protein M3O71_25145 [Bacteroidota bacterium]|nr:hypothetical protein [Bacteroidota bacterium]
MTDELIVQQLRDKEQQLINELNKVRLAITAFINDNTTFEFYNFNKISRSVPLKFDRMHTYGNKILYILSVAGEPMLVDEITDELLKLEPELDYKKLHKSISHNVSMLAKYGKVKKHPYNRKIKYSLPSQGL